MAIKFDFIEPETISISWRDARQHGKSIDVTQSVWGIGAQCVHALSVCLYTDKAVAAAVVAYA